MKSVQFKFDNISLVQELVQETKFGRLIGARLISCFSYSVLEISKEAS